LISSPPPPPVNPPPPNSALRAAVDCCVLPRHIEAIGGAQEVAAVRAVWIVLSKGGLWKFRNS
jgi:hypothetical protein